MDLPVQVPVDDPNADTEWNDILRKHGIIPEKPPSPTPQIEEALAEARRLAHENRLEGKNLDELDELEDEEDEEFFQKYRKQRLAEMSSISASSIYNQVYHLQKPEYSKEVTEVSKQAFVVVLLTSSQGGNTESKLLADMWPNLARTFGDIKFCQMRADMCIEGYPEKNTPTILAYRDTDIRKQLVTLGELRGARTTSRDIEKMLTDVGAIRQGDPRLQGVGERAEHEKSGTRIRTGRDARGDGDSDSDWD